MIIHLKDVNCFLKSFRKDQISNASLHKNAENFAIEACLNNLTLLVQQPDQMAVRTKVQFTKYNCLIGSGSIVLLINGHRIPIQKK